MDRKYIFYFLLILVVKVSSTLADENDNETYDEDESEMLNIKLEIQSFSESLQQSTSSVQSKTKTSVETVQNNIDSALEQLADTLVILFSTRHQYYQYGNPNYTPSPSVFSFHNIAVNTANKIKSIKEKLHNRLENLMIYVDESASNFRNSSHKQILDLQCKFDLLKEKYPGIESPGCYQMLKKFKTSLSTLFKNTIQCVTVKIYSQITTLDDIDDITLEDLTDKVNIMKEAWDCSIRTKGNYFYKFIKCTKFSSASAVWNLLRTLMHQLDTSVESQLTQIQNSITFASCMGKKFASQIKDDMFGLIRTLSICSADIQSSKQDVTHKNVDKQVSRDCRLPSFVPV